MDTQNPTSQPIGLQEPPSPIQIKVKQRGKFLTTLILLGIFFYIVNFFRISDTQRVVQVYGQIPPGYIILEGINYTIGIVLLGGIWLWKKFAVYLFFILIILQLVINNIVYRPPKFPPVELMLLLWTVGLFPPLLYLWAIRRKWNFFK